MSEVKNACFPPYFKKILERKNDFMNGKYEKIIVVNLIDLPYNGVGNLQDYPRLSVVHKDFLDSILEESKEAGKVITIKKITGFASPDGSEPSNYELSQLRAEDVYSYFADQRPLVHKLILPEQASVQGKGEIDTGYFPYDDNVDDPLRRRVEIIYVLNFDFSLISQTSQNDCLSDMWQLGFNQAISSSTELDALKLGIIGGETGVGTLRQINPERIDQTDCGNKSDNTTKYNERHFRTLSITLGYEKKLLKKIDNLVAEGTADYDQVAKTIVAFILGTGINIGSIVNFEGSGGFVTDKKHSLKDLENSFIVTCTISASASIASAGATIAVLLIPIIENDGQGNTTMSFALTGTILGGIDIGSTTIQPGFKAFFSFGAIVFKD